MGGSPGSGSRNSLSCASITTICASAWTMSLRVCATKSSIEANRIGSGSTTTVAPASQVAWMAVTHGRVVAPVDDDAGGGNELAHCGNRVGMGLQVDDHHVGAGALLGSWS